MKKKTVQEQSQDARALILATEEIKRQKGLVRFWRRVSVCLCVLMLILTLIQGYAYAHQPYQDDTDGTENRSVPEEMIARTDNTNNAILVIRNEQKRKYGRRRQRACP